MKKHMTSYLVLSLCSALVYGVFVFLLDLLIRGAAEPFKEYLFQSVAFGLVFGAFEMYFQKRKKNKKSGEE